MTLQDLLDELTALPASARTAEVDLDVTSVRYDRGVVIVEVDEDKKESYDDGYDDGFRDEKKAADDDR